VGNPHLIHNLFFDDSTLICFASDLVLTVSLLAPSTDLAKIIGALLSSDLAGRVKGSASEEFGAPLAASHPELVADLSDNWIKQLQRPLAIAWTRCRRSLNPENP